MYPLPLPLGPVYVHFTVSRQHLLEAFPLRAAFPLFLFYNQKVSFFGGEIVGVPQAKILHITTTGDHSKYDQTLSIKIGG